MDLYDILHNDHEQVLDTMDSIRQASDRAIKTRERQFEKLIELVTTHMTAEERTFYNELMKHDDLRKMALEAQEEHNVARNILTDLERTAREDEAWPAKFKVLYEILEHHIDEEEEEIFEAARERIGEQETKHLAERFRGMKKQTKSV